MEDYSIIELPNGIRCIHHRVQSAVANIALTVNSGTRDESLEQHGVAHLVEHMLFKGTDRRSAFRINNRLDSVGGDLNAFTTKEETVIYATCLKTDAAKAIDLLTDMLFHSNYPQAEIEKEKTVIIDEINSYRDTPSELIFDEFEELLFANSPLGRNILGTPSQLKKIRRNHLTDYVKDNYLTNRIVISSSSSWTHGRFKSECEKILAPIQPNNTPYHRKKPVTNGAFEIVKTKHTHQTHTVIGGYGYSLFDTRRTAFSLLINLLGGQSAISRLNQIIREKHALTYSIEAGYSPYCDTGIWNIYFGCEPQNHTRIVDLITNEIKSLQTVLISDTKLRQAKKQFIGQLLIGADNNENFIMAMAKSLLVFDTFDTNSDLIKKINSVTSAQILEAALDLMSLTRMCSLTYK